MPAFRRRSLPPVFPRGGGGGEGTATRRLIIPELCVLVLTKRHVGSGLEIVEVQTHAARAFAWEGTGY